MYKSKLNIWGTVSALLTLIIMFHIFNLNIVQEEQNKYLEASELTNYTLLETLINPSKNISLGPEHDDTPQISENRINFNLQSLTDLTARISLKNTFTVVVKYHDQASLSTQLESILRQTYKPTTIYVIGTNKEKSIIKSVIQQQQHNDMIQFTTHHDWLSNLKFKTDFVFVLNHHQVQPGSGYMKFILRLLNTPHFKNTFIGTENNCESSTFEKAHYVNKIHDIWAFRREWLSHIKVQQQHPSIALYQSLKIASVVIPTSKKYLKLLGNTKPTTKCQQQQDEEGAILFYAQDNASAAFNELICQFNRHHKVIHLVSATSISCSFDHENVIIHHSITRVKNEFNQLVNILSPRVVIHESQASFTMDRMTSFVKQEHEITYIGLPKMDDVAPMLWMANLPISSLEQWNIPRVKLIITTSGNKKLNNMKRILNSLQNANYLCDRVDLSLFMDEKSDAATRQFVNHVEWTAGDKQIRHRISSVHPMQHFVESWYPSDNHEYAVLLDDRIELSNLFYIWIKQSLLNYRYTNNKNDQLFGISLYSPRIIDTDPSGRQILIRKDDMPYLMQSTTGAGALYFPEYWREFHDYITARLTDQAIFKKKTKHRHLLKDSLLVKSRSDTWMNSWRKYFDEVIYMRGYVMLYPSFYKSYSTLNIVTKKTFENVNKLYHLPLSDTVLPQLPDIDSLEILDYYGQSVKQGDELIVRGHDIQRTFSACKPKIDHHHDPSDMLCPFSHIIKIPIDQSQNDLPTLSVNLVA